MRAANNNNLPEDLGFGEQSSSGSMTEALDLQHYIRILRKNKWPITAFTALVTALAVYYVITATPIYRATSTLLIESQKANIVSVEELYGIDNENQDYYQTQFELLKSRGLAQQVVDRLSLYDHPELNGRHLEVATVADPLADSEAGGEGEGFVASAVGTVNGLLEKVGIGAPEANSVGDQAASAEGFSVDQIDATLSPEEQRLVEENRREGVVQNFMSRLTITPVRKTKLVKISYESADPVLAARVANAVGEQYITSYLDAKMELTSQASEWLSERLSSLKQTLDTSEQRLLKFKQENGLVDVDGSVGRLNEQELLLTTTELAEARRDLSDASDMYREVQGLRSNFDVLQTLPSIQADPLVRSVKIEQGQRQRELDELLNRYGNRHPKVVDARSRVDSLNGTLSGHIQRAVGAIEKDFQLARQRVASIEQTLAVGKQEIQSIGNKKFELDSLEREVSTNRDLYNTFFSRMSEAKSADGLESANARVSDPAITPRDPVKPRKQLIVALAALASLMFSMLMAFLYEQMDDTIKSTSDVEDKLKVKLLGIVPLLKGGLFNRTQVLPLDPRTVHEYDKKGTFTEAVNTARTAVCINDGDRPTKVIMVTSSVPGEGKSTTSINLAYSLSKLEKVLLIDCDMRRPTIAKAINLDAKAEGLSNLIADPSSAKNCIRRRAMDTLDVLPSGQLPLQPLELLASNRFKKIIEQLSEHYDRIVLDCAPTQAVSDALVLSKVSDAVVYCVKSHDTSIDLVRRGLQRLEQVGAPVAGVLITQVDIDKIQSYGGDYYYQGYYDYYGYSDKEKSAQGGRGKLILSQDQLHAIKADDSDIDLGLHGAALKGRVAKAGAAQNGVSRQSMPMAESEFDMTTQVDVSHRSNGASSAAAPHGMRSNGARNGAASHPQAEQRARQPSNERSGDPSSRRFIDDLDLL